MKNSRGYIKKNDYEIYSVGIPLKMLIGSWRRRFLYSELEKLHPCFSEDCSFDSRLKIGRNGLKEIKADVVVMNKLKLAEYRERFGGKKLFLEEGLKHCVFAEGKKRKILCLMVLCLFFALALVRLLRPVKLKTEKNMAEAITNVEHSSQKKEGAVEEVFFESGEQVEALLKTVEAKNGKLKELEWKCNNFNEGFFTTVNFLYGEDFCLIPGKIEKSSVSYRNGLPEIRVSGTGRIKKQNENELKDQETGVTIGLPSSDEKKAGTGRIESAWNPYEFRKLLGKFYITPLEEQENPYSIKFNLENVSAFTGNRLISEITDYLLTHNLCLEQLKITAPGNGTAAFELKVNYQLEYFRGIKPELLKNKMFLFNFGKKKSGAREEVKVAVEEKKVLPDSSVKKENQKLGEIRHFNGASLVFYKNQKGKMLVEKSENWNGNQKKS